LFFFTGSGFQVLVCNFLIYKASGAKIFGVEGFLVSGLSGVKIAGVKVFVVQSIAK